MAVKQRPASLWPASQIEYRRLDRLTPYARNARTHSPAQIAQIAASIREWGWTMPCLVDETDMLLAGHGRVLAAQMLKLTEAPVIVARGWDEPKKRAYILADNKLSLNAGWDDAMLAAELAALAVEPALLELTGFSALELAELGADRTDGLTDPDDVPDVQLDPITRRGDLWLLGRHRLICGDATSEVDVSHALGGVRPHLMVTDPPYGVNYDANWRNEAAAKGLIGQKKATRAVGVVHNDDRADWSEAWALFPGDVAYVWCAPGPLNCAVHDSLRDSGLEPRMQIVWAKSQFVIGRGNYHAQHENCWYAVRKSGTAHWSGDRKQSTVWQIDKPHKSETGHSTQKPVACMQRPIENNSSPGQAVYEPFCGSGTTIIAAEMTGRACHAIELSSQYVDVAVRRWQAFSGQSATLYGTDKSFAAIEAERQAA